MSAIASMAWRSRLWRYAEKVSGGKWKPYPHLKHVANVIQDVVQRNLEGDPTAPEVVIIEMPPRSGKSTLCSEWLPKWFLDTFPDKSVIMTAYGDRAAAKWGRRVRNDIATNGRILVDLAPDSKAANRWETKEGGGMISAGISGAITGEGAHLIILDDPHRNWREANSPTLRKKVIESFDADLWTRREAGATVVVFHTRWHEADLAGYLQSDAETEDEGAPSVLVVRLPALAEEDDELGREPGEALCPEMRTVEQYRRIAYRYGTRDFTGHWWTTAGRMFAAMFQQRPAPEDGNELSREWVRFYRRDDLPVPGVWDFLAVSIDASFKGEKESKTGRPDYVVMQAWCVIGLERYLLDQWRGRWSFVETLVQMDNFLRRWSGDMELNPGHERPGWVKLGPKNKLRAIYIEDKANGPAIISAMQTRFSGIIPVDPGDYGSKLVRMRAVAPLWKGGNVLIPHKDEAGWVESVYLREHFLFPNAQNDDCVDASNQALLLLPASERSRKRKGGKPPPSPIDDLLGSIG